MSTDLVELHRDLPRIRVPSIAIDEALQSCTITTTSLPEENNSTGIQQENHDSDDCRTPTSEEQKIPVILCCPRAPRKPRKTVSCKRKLSEIEFFEIVNREEVESFFRSSFEIVAKRRCTCT